MGKVPMISVIVPVYNTEKYLGRCIESIQKQRVEELELILVDDGSRDFSGRLCDRYAKADRRIKVIHKTNGGLVSARKAGLAEASGEYVGFVDSDDWIEGEMLYAMVRKAQETDADVVAEGYVEDVSGLCQRRRNMLKAGEYRTEEERGFFYQNMLSCEDYFCLGMQPYLWNKLIRREVAEGCIRGVEDSLKVGEDAAAVYPMFLEAKSIVVSEECHYHYCQRKASMIWKRESEERELAGAVQLHQYLRGKLCGEEDRYGLVGQLERYTANNLLVRSLGMLAKSQRETALFPFKAVKRGERVVIYGAGAFGRAVYQYARESGTVTLKGWTDQNAAAYRRLGLPVEEPEELRIERQDKILIAVLRKKAEEAIRERLSGLGVKKEQMIGIAGISLEDMTHKWVEEGK